MPDESVNCFGVRPRMPLSVWARAQSGFIRKIRQAGSSGTRVSILVAAPPTTFAKSIAVELADFAKSLILLMAIA